MPRFPTNWSFARVYAMGLYRLSMACSIHVHATISTSLVWDAWVVYLLECDGEMTDMLLIERHKLSPFTLNFRPYDGVATRDVFPLSRDHYPSKHWELFLFELKNKKEGLREGGLEGDGRLQPYPHLCLMDQREAVVWFPCVLQEKCSVLFIHLLLPSQKTWETRELGPVFSIFKEGCMVW